MNKDLTIGNPRSVLWKFCLPLFGSVIFQQLYNIADSFVAGKFLGEDALAAVGNSYEITLIFIAFAFGCNIGCSVIVSRFFGAKKFKDMKTTVYTSLIACGVICALLMFIGLLLTDPLLELINTPSNILEDSASYLRIYIFSLPFVFYYNVATGIFSAMGDSKTPFFFLMFSSLSNIGMDILFVTALLPLFSRGVDGVAWATFLCQGVSCILAMIFVILRLNKIQTDGKVQFFSWSIFCQIAIIAVPSILQQSSISIGNIIIQSIINSFGSSVTAGYAAAIKLNNLCITSFTTIGNGISNFTSQNFGAGKNERIKSGFKYGFLLIFIIALPMIGLYCGLGKYLLLIFLNESSEVALTVGRTFLWIVSPFYITGAVKLASDGVLRGTGMMNQFMVSTFADLILRVVLAYFLSIPFGSTGIWMAWPVGWLVGAVISILFYLHGKWRKDIHAPDSAEAIKE